MAEVTILSSDSFVEELFSTFCPEKLINSSSFPHNLQKYPIELENLALPHNHGLSGLGIRGGDVANSANIGNVIANRIIQELRILSLSSPLSLIDKRLQLLWCRVPTFKLYSSPFCSSQHYLKSDLTGKDEHELEPPQAGEKDDEADEENCRVTFHMDSGSQQLLDFVPNPVAVGQLPLSAQIGIRLFFSLLRTLKVSSNPACLRKLVEQLSKLLVAMPPLALSANCNNALGNDSGTVPSESALLGVVDSMGAVLERAIIPMTGLSAFKVNSARPGVPLSLPVAAEEHAAALSALFGLSVKRGSLSHILRAVIRMLLYAPIIPLDSGIDSVPVLGSRGGSKKRGGSRDHTPRAATSSAGVEEEHMRGGRVESPDLLLDVAAYLRELCQAECLAEAVTEKSLLSGSLMSFGKGDHGKVTALPCRCGALLLWWHCVLG